MTRQELSPKVRGNEIPKKTTIIASSVRDFIEIVRINDGHAGGICEGKLTTRGIGGKKNISLTRFLIEIRSQISPKKEKSGKEIVMEKIIGERKNPPEEIFEIFNLELHKQQLGSKERMEEISKMPHFEKTKELVLKGIGSVEWDLLGIENKLPGVKGFTASG